MAFLAGGGETGALIRAHDWSDSGLGHPAQWPQSLKTALRIMLTSRQPIWVGWGPDLIFFYNDPYKSIIGGRHPAAMAQPTRQVWSEIWAYMAPLLRTAMTDGTGTYEEQKLLIMERNGYPEETYYTFSFSPVPGDDGSLSGIICVNSDETRRVTSDRQRNLLRELAIAMPQSATWRQACELSARALAVNPHDIPFAMLYAVESGGETAELVGACGIEPGTAGAPSALALDGAAWPCGDALRANAPMLVKDLPVGLHGQLPQTVWNRPASQAVLVPILPSSEGEPVCLLICALNPLRLYTDDYREFLMLAAAQIGTSIRFARAYEHERSRAQALAEIDHAKTAFFSNISHEFRTPLTLMLAPLEDMLADTGLPPRLRSTVEMTSRNGLRLLKLVNTLLDFSRIEAGRVQLDPRPTDVSALTADLASLFRSSLEKAGLSLVIDCPALPRAAMLDRDMWEKVILNLLSNAYKFTYQGGVRVAARVAPDGETAIVEISDTGVGVPADELPRIFDRFHQVEGSQGRSMEGSGIGLALVQEFMRLQRGSVAAASTPGVGTTFTLSLPLGPVLDTSAALPAASAPPLARAYVDAPDPAATSAGTGARPTVATSGTVLVVDDNDDMRAYISRVLGSANYKVDTAPDGQSALAHARKHRPDLVLSDVMMPRLDGFGLLAALREDPALRTVPVLLLSARAGEEASVEGLRAGADDYLTKPFSARELLARVSSNLRLNALRQETAKRLADEARTLEILNGIGSVVAAELDMAKAVQAVVNAATELTGASMGLLSYPADRNSAPATAPRVAHSGTVPAAPLTAARIAAWPVGAGVLRHDDLMTQGIVLPGQKPPPAAARSYLSAPVRGRDGALLGHLYLTHPRARVFDARAERLIGGIAAQAAIAIGNALLYQAAQEEIAERARAQAALRDLNGTLELRIGQAIAERDRLWEHSDDLLVIADGQGRMLRFSPSWTRRLGFPESALAFQRYDTLIHPEDLPQAQAQLAALRTSSRSLRAEHRVRTAQDEWRWLAWTWSFDAESDSIHGVGRDITTDKASAQALHETEEALRMAQKMEALGKLTGGVAHDFNNLLQVIGGNLQLLSRGLTGDERAQQRAQHALAGVERGSKLASQLLAFGRRQPLAPKVVNLGRFLRGFDDMLRRAIGDGVELETVASGGLWNTLVDPNQVENALLNLAINARDAMEGHGKLTVEAGNASLDDDYATRHAEVRPGQYVMLAVSDTGCGMDKNLAERAFEPFFTTKPEGQGTGLGLSMVYGFVRQTGGHIKIYSEPGIGTTVRLYLPRANQPEDRITELDTADAEGGDETVLVVEDDEDVRLTVVDMLSDLGYRVLKARDAQSAMSIIESGVNVDLLFTDVVMPGPLRSRDVALRARERLPRLAVLFTSGYADNAIVHGGRLDDGIELLSKPYTAAVLARKVRQMLRQRPPAPQAPAPGPAVSSKRVLLVEDMDAIRLTTGEILGSLGHEVVQASTAAQASAQLQQQHIDILLTDVGLPDGSGIALAVWARTRQPELAVVFATGRDVLADACIQAGLHDARQLLKPYSPQQLECVISMLDHPSGKGAHD